jgi:AhpD family alkylhydroperoxidase
MLHRPIPELLAAFWGALRETLVAGRVPRAEKEAVALVVSKLNRCPYCVDAHSTMLTAAGKGEAAAELERGRMADLSDPKVRAVAEWAAASRSPGSEQVLRPPFGREEAPEIIGVAVLFHYVNRMVSAFLGESPFPLGGRLLRGSLRRIGGLRFRRFVRARVRPGEWLDLLPAAELPDEFRWASASGSVARALAGFAATVDEVGERFVAGEVRRVLLSRLASWRGEDPGLGVAWLEQELSDLTGSLRDQARLAFLVALAPYRAGAVAADQSDPETLAVAAFASLAAARRVASWLGPAFG